MTFSENDKLKALAIVNVFETSRPFGDHAACVVLNDGAGVSYGINQFTHRSGSLAAVVDAYLDNGGQIGRDILAGRLPSLRRTTVYSIRKMAADEQFKKALRSAAVTREMKTAQQKIAFEKYLSPALEICEARGFVLPLSLAVVYDSVVHGSWERIASRVGRNAGCQPASQTQAGCPRANEKAWITEYVRRRHSWLTSIPRLKVTTYRTKFFLDQIANGNWDLRLPMLVHGVRLSESMFPVAVSETGAPATGPSDEERQDLVGSTSDAISAAVEKFDRVDRVVTGFAVRRDSVRSLWTTVAGTLWQAVWAVFGFVVGLPKEVWIVVAVIAAALMLVYLYRQIALGKIREQMMSEPPA